MFQKLRFYLVIASLLVVFGCNLSGTISENGTPLGDVTVTLSGPSSVSTITDSNGEFAFNFIRQGT
ncbi:MAG: carboxypeptidase regulatory-like domain-containing protein, partial [candidate division Zixibacteria bacterium]|nr:carboxypeptidase regulatory-like domain-containing protein [candidate division Zixibacteria bacterium]